MMVVMSATQQLRRVEDSRADAELSQMPGGRRSQ